jgi:hypothetical protein
MKIDRPIQFSKSGFDLLLGSLSISSAAWVCFMYFVDVGVYVLLYLQCVKILLLYSSHNLFFSINFLYSFFSILTCLFGCWLITLHVYRQFYVFGFYVTLLRATRKVLICL